MKTYISKRHISHNNQDYEAGELLELDDKTATPLLMVGAIVDAPVEIVPDPDNLGNKDTNEADEQKQDSDIAQISIDADSEAEITDATKSKSTTKSSKKAK